MAFCIYIVKFCSFPSAWSQHCVDLAVPICFALGSPQWFGLESGSSNKGARWSRWCQWQECKLRAEYQPFGFKCDIPVGKCCWNALPYGRVGESAYQWGLCRPSCSAQVCLDCPEPSCMGISWTALRALCTESSKERNLYSLDGHS